MDAWRVVLPMLGIVYHGIAAEMRRGNLTDYDIVLNAIHSFRMESFFAMAGLLAGTRIMRPGYLHGRLRSTLIPVATLWVLALLANPSKGTSLLSGSTEHLWFLLCLAELSALAVICERVGMLRWLDRRAGWPTIAAIAIPSIFAIRAVFAFVRPEIGSDLAFTFVESLYYCPYFLFGTAVARNRGLAAALARNPLAWLLGPIAMIALLVVGGLAGSPFATPAYVPWMDALRMACAIGFAVTVIGTSVGVTWAATPTVVWLANAGYTVYLLHYPFITLGEKLFDGLPLGPRLALVMLLAGAAPLVVYWFMTRSPILKTLLNGAPYPRRTQRPRAARRDPHARRAATAAATTGFPDGGGVRDDSRRSGST